MATKYERVQEILRNADGTGSPYHDGKRKFWDLPLADFIKVVVYGVAIIAPPGPNRGANSGLIKALKGEKPFDGSRFQRMPMARPPVAPPDIQFIQDWIDAGCPDEPLEAAPEVAFSASSKHAPATPVAGTPDVPMRGITTTNLVRQERSGTLKLRKNVVRLDDTEIAKYRDAVDRMKKLPANDPRNWNRLADIHAQYCNNAHNTEWFLPWHRAYLYNFEKAMQEMVPGVTLPYWDWAGTAEVPEPYRTNGGNPLFDGTRDPGLPDELPSRTEVDDVQQNSPDFITYGGRALPARRGGRLEGQPHNTVHRWAGGNMLSTITAALDPIFWAHHCNVDRLWHLWSKTHPGARPVDLDSPLEPFSFTARDVLSISTLGYEYAAAEILFTLNREVGFAKLATPRFSLGETLKDGEFRRAELQVLQVPPPKESAIVRMFVGESAADSSTPTDRPTYAGRFALFGKDRCIGGPGHCDVPREPRQKFDLRPPHHMEPSDIQFDITNALKYALESQQEVTVTLVTVDQHGRPLESDILSADAVTIVLKD